MSSHVTRRAADAVVLRCRTAASARYSVDTTRLVQFVRERSVAASREWRQPTSSDGSSSASASVRRASPGKYVIACSQTASALQITYPASVYYWLHVTYMFVTKKMSNKDDKHNHLPGRPPAHQIMYDDNMPVG